MGRTRVKIFVLINGVLPQPVLARLFCPVGGALPAPARARAGSFAAARGHRTDGHAYDVCWIEDWSGVFGSELN